MMVRQEDRTVLEDPLEPKELKELMARVDPKGNVEIVGNAEIKVIPEIMAHKAQEDFKGLEALRVTTVQKEKWVTTAPKVTQEKWKGYSLILWQKLPTTMLYPLSLILHL